MEQVVGVVSRAVNLAIVLATGGRIVEIDI